MTTRNSSSNRLIITLLAALVILVGAGISIYVYNTHQAKIQECIDNFDDVHPLVKLSGIEAEEYCESSAMAFAIN